MWSQLLNAAIGLALLFLPAIFRYGGAPRTNDEVVGPLVIAIGLVAAWEATRPVRWANLPVGLWIAFSPWAVGYHGPARPLHFVAGLVIATLAAAPVIYRPWRFGGGWTVVWAQNEPGASRPGSEPT